MKETHFLSSAFCAAGASDSIWLRVVTSMSPFQWNARYSSPDLTIGCSVTANTE
jgi:hypothetical protein